MAKKMTQNPSWSQPTAPRLCGSRLYGSRLCGSRLCGSRLCGSHLCSPRLCGSRLYGSRLCGSRLCGSRLYGSRLYGPLLALATLALVPALDLVASPWTTAPALGGTCASNCGAPPLQFEPGELIAVQVVNLTQGLVEVQEAQGSDAFPLPPGRVTQLERLGSTTVNSSVLFWDTLGLGLKVKLVKVDDNTLRVELQPNYTPPGDRSIYLRDDGRIDIL